MWVWKHLISNVWYLKYFILATDPQTTYFASALQEATVDALNSCKNLLQEILDGELPYVNPGRENIEDAMIILDLAIQNAGLFHDSMYILYVTQNVLFVFKRWQLK